MEQLMTGIFVRNLKVLLLVLGLLFRGFSASRRAASVWGHRTPPTETAEFRI